MIEAVLVARLPASTGPPQLVEVGALPGSGLAWAEELADDGRAEITVLPDSLTDNVADLLADLNRPSEMRVYVDGAVVWAGPVVGWQTHPVGEGGVEAVRVSAVGLRFYLRRLILGDTVELVTGPDPETPFTFDQTGVWAEVLAAALARPYVGGAYGLNFDTIAECGVDRDALAALAIDRVADVMATVADLDDGFDFLVTPDDRQVRAAYPRWGVDRSAGVVIDRRNVWSLSWAWAAGAEDVVSDVWVTGGPDTAAGVVGHAQSPEVLADHGESSLVVADLTLTKQAALDAAAQAALDARAGPAAAFAPVVYGVEAVLDFDVGDTVAIGDLDTFGTPPATARVIARSVRVDDDGLVTGELTFA